MICVSLKISNSAKSSIKTAIKTISATSANAITQPAKVYTFVRKIKIAGIMSASSIIGVQKKMNVMMSTVPIFIIIQMMRTSIYQKSLNIKTENTERTIQM